jgi:hypothetical protein
MRCIHYVAVIAMCIVAALSGAAPQFATSAHAAMNHNETFLGARTD